MCCKQMYPGSSYCGIKSLSILLNKENAVEVFLQGNTFKAGTGQVVEIKWLFSDLLAQYS